MSITQVTIASPANEILFTDTSLSNVVDAIKASSAKLYYITVDNSLNVASSYVKLFNAAAGGITLGTTVPDEVIFVPASSIITMPYFTSSAPGKTFATALSAACVTTGGTSGTTSPASSVVFTATYV